MKYSKTREKLDFKEFLVMVSKVKSFKSTEGENYSNLKLNDNVLEFKRDSTNVIWDVDLEKIYNGFNELENINTSTLKRYVPIKQSPSLGLLLELGLLIKN